MASKLRKLGKSLQSDTPRLTLFIDQICIKSDLKNGGL